VRKKKESLLSFFNRMPQLCGEATINTSEEEMKIEGGINKSLFLFITTEIFISTERSIYIAI